MIKFTEKTHTHKVGKSKYRAVYMKKDGIRYLVDTLGTGRGESLYREHSLARIAAAKDALIKNDGKFCKYRGNHGQPTEMLREMLENDYHFEDGSDMFSELYSAMPGGKVTRFCGYVRETHTSFDYRIYDEGYLETVKNLADEILQKQGPITELEDSMFIASEASESSTCPICGNDDLSFNQSEYADGYVQHQFTCAMCGAVGSESEKTVFDGFYIDSVPDWYLVQQAAIANATEMEGA